MSALICYRCPECGSVEVGWDANSVWNPVAQSTEMGGEFDNGWCRDCGDVQPEQYEPEGDELAELQADIAVYENGQRLASLSPELVTALRTLLFAARDGAVLPRDHAHMQAMAVLAKVPA